MKYTLVQHTGYSVGGKGGFKQAVELRSFDHTETEKSIRKLGGVVYDTYIEASKAQQQYNYPPGYKGLIPQASGMFKILHFLEEKIFCPDIKE